MTAAGQTQMVSILTTAGGALQRVDAALGEIEPRADDQLLDRAGNTNLPWIGQGADPSADVHRHAGHVIADQLDLARVDAGADADIEPRQALADCTGAANRPGRAVEGGEGALGRSISASAPVGLVPWRSSRAHQRVNSGSAAALGAQRPAPTGPPHSWRNISLNTSSNSSLIPWG